MGDGAVVSALIVHSNKSIEVKLEFVISHASHKRQFILNPSRWSERSSFNARGPIVDHPLLHRPGARR